MLKNTLFILKPLTLKIPDDHDDSQVEAHLHRIIEVMLVEMEKEEDFHGPLLDVFLLPLTAAAKKDNPRACSLAKVRVRVRVREKHSRVAV